jgi:hypothetical protein
VLDTVRVGGLFIVERPVDADVVRRAAELAWPRLDSLYGDEAARLARLQLRFWFVNRMPRFPETTEMVEPVIADSSATRDDVARQLVYGAASLLRAGADSALAVWLGPPLVPMTQPDAELARIYIDLVTAPSVAVRRCYQGDAGSCRAALGLLDDRDRAEQWYDAAERRAVVRKIEGINRARVRSTADACLVGNSDEACLETLRSLPFLDAPLSAESRHAFARIALATGGRGAFGRLLRSAGRPIAERFASAGRLPADSLAMRWRATILAARPKTVTLVAGAGWTALGWAVVFGLLALRSTRWR